MKVRESQGQSLSVRGIGKQLTYGKDFPIEGDISGLFPNRTNFPMSRISRTPRKSQESPRRFGMFRTFWKSY